MMLKVQFEMASLHGKNNQRIADWFPLPGYLFTPHYEEIPDNTTTEAVSLVLAEHMLSVWSNDYDSET